MYIHNIVTQCLIYKCHLLCDHDDDHQHDELCKALRTLRLTNTEQRHRHRHAHTVDAAPEDAVALAQADADAMAVLCIMSMSRADYALWSSSLW